MPEANHILMTDQPELVEQALVNWLARGAVTMIRRMEVGERHRQRRTPA